MGTDITVTQLGSPADPTYLVRRLGWSIDEAGQSGRK